MKLDTFISKRRGCLIARWINGGEGNNTVGVTRTTRDNA